MEAAIETSPSDRSRSLYETDFYAWTRQQAACLEHGELAAADIANIREEIEALGRKEVAGLRSRLRGLVAHLLKTIYQPDRATRSWVTTILNQRIAIADHISDNPSLKAGLADVFAKAYDDARDLAASETGLAVTTFPETPDFTCAEAMSRSWNPGTARRNEDDEANG